jgi:hypothetical protein
MSSVAFVESTFRTEMKNTEFALRHFDAGDVGTSLAHWEQRIVNGDHRVIEFEGAQGT